MFSLPDPSIQLDQVRRKIGAPKIDWAPRSDALSPRDEIRIRLSEGIELNLDEVETTAGLFEHKGEQVVIYIKDHTGAMARRNLSTIQLLAQPEQCRRVHLVECSTIEEMRAKGRFERYVVTNRRDNKYEISVIDEHNEVNAVDAILRPCIHCLKALNYQDYNSVRRAEQKVIREGFDVDGFFENFTTFFAQRPLRWAHEDRASQYIAGWERLSERTRAARNWTCQDCGVVLSDPGHKKYLHVHHKNHVKGDNSPENLEVVCALCHQAKPDHQNMFISHRGREIIQRRRGF